jgi:hypothetical protein
MLPMGEGPFPYARDSLYFSKPVRPFSWPVCPHSFNARTAFSLNLFGFATRKAFVVTAKTCHTVPASMPEPQLVQFTNRRMRTFITIPSARNVNRTDEPP